VRRGVRVAERSLCLRLRFVEPLLLDGLEQEPGLREQPIRDPRQMSRARGLTLELLIGPIGWLGLIFGVPIWTLGTSLFVLLGARERAQAAAATA